MKKPKPAGKAKYDKNDVRMGAVWVRLAAWLNVPKETLRDWRKMASAPKRPLKRPWLRFREARKVGGAPIIADANGSENLLNPRLKDQKTQMEIRLLEAKVAKEERKVVPIGDVASLLTHIGATVRSQLYDALETEAPPKLVGQDAATIRVRLREMADTICTSVSDIITSFEKDELKKAKQQKKHAEEEEAE